MLGCRAYHQHLVEGTLYYTILRQYTHHAHFHDFPSALKLLFQCATGQDWKFVMYAVGGEPGQPEGMVSFFTTCLLLFCSAIPYVRFIDTTPVVIHPLRK